MAAALLQAPKTAMWASRHDCLREDMVTAIQQALYLFQSEHSEL